MVKCSSCGAEILGGQKFCIKCGAKVSVENIGVQNQDQSSQSQSVDENHADQTQKVKLPKVNFNLTKKNKIIAIVTVITVVLLIIAGNVGKSLTSREKVVEKFNQALASKNSSKLAKYIDSTDVNQKIDGKGVDGLLSYIKKNPSYENEIKTSIEDQSSKIDTASKSKESAQELLEQLALDFDTTDDLFTLKKKGKTWLFYDKYVLEFKPVYIKLETNYKDTQIFLDDKLIATADKEKYEKEVGPYMPGLYKMKTSLKGKYSNIEKTEDVDLVKAGSSSDGNQRVASVDLNMDAYEISVESDFEDSKLFVNAKDTGILVKDAKQFGPVSKDGSVKLYAQKEFPWGIEKSKEVKVTGENTITLNIAGANDKVTATLMDTINVYKKGWAESRTSRDVSKILNVSEKRKKISIEAIEDMIKNKDLTIFKMKTSLFDLDSIIVYQKDNKYYAEVDDFGKADYIEYKEAGTVPTAVEKQCEFKYVLIYDETSKKWLVDSVDDLYGTPSENTKEFTF
ncbi:zinc ribbon domain-containing protein [Clostridium lacusfryxellense]|uniref:zinc ribbon domain-containing protein n=1 Tax=Clostridium lacusfryxellense TaxID=205328 RepID=UPI001C0C3A25|nr:zinc-ribbon domain-containing protein [Clostridium lacusfryxellense]MBU3112334.1 zinc-ribbon domain-containing protein [Clostridium lacusfryxellense]